MPGAHDYIYNPCVFDRKFAAGATVELDVKWNMDKKCDFYRHVYVCPKDLVAERVLLETVYDKKHIYVIDNKNQMKRLLLK